MQQAVVSNMRPIASSPVPRRCGGWSCTASPCAPGRGSLRMRSIRNGSTESLDHLQRASKARQQQQQPGNGAAAPRRRIIQTSPFGLWDSFPEARTLDQMVRTMERIMDGDGDDGRVLVAVPRADDSGVAAVAGPSPAAAARRRGRTPWEIKERAGEYLVRFDMPGMTREDVRVSVQDRTLVVTAEKAAAAESKREGKGAAGEEDDDEEGEAWPAASFGRYRTRVELPENVEVERIAAEVRDGVLYLTIPKVNSGGKVVNIQVQ
ncbi:hypothetical protein ACP4OV_016269 [Aristida adscensionis]